jgi:hypothetical protein
VWRAKAEAVSQSVNEHLWSEAKGAYVRGWIDGRALERLAVHDSVLAASVGIAPSERIGRGLATVFGTADAVQIGTPYFYFFYLQALRRAGRHQEALDATRHAYGKMVAAGATTWWEHLAGHASLSHGWSTAPNIDLPMHVLGVHVTEPGFTAFRVSPEPADLAWARGVIPTVQGDIAVEWRREGSTFALRVGVPMSARVELSVPATSLESASFTGATQPERSDFKAGRARYWVTGPGTFEVNSALPPAPPRGHEGR